MKPFGSLILLLLCVASSALAEPMPESDIPYRYLSWEVKYDVNADGSFVVTEKWSRTVLKENALERLKDAYVTFSTSVAKGEILEAYTVKKSGQRLDAPKDSYQVNISDGYKKVSPLFSDETTISVVFPDLAVGDTTVFSSRVTNTEGMFPNHFSASHGFSPFGALDDAAMEIIAPAAMKLKTRSYFLDELKPEMKEGKQILRWTYRNKTPEKWTPADNGISVIGESPALYVSSFGSYKEIAEAYGSRATPKAAVTERVKNLATEIVADKKTPETQARALYDWVAQNIAYGGNCIGIGAVVPRDLAVVLDNKMGDCKDHATLLQALLASRSIESEQALIDAGGPYQLPDVPIVGAVNHVINYVPAMNLFLDATSSDTPFGMLPMNLGEKPVLLVSHYREGMKTPSNAQYGHEQTMRTSVAIKSDGSATGDIEMSLKGIPAVAARAFMRAAPSGQEEFMAKRMLEAQGMHGTGTLTKDDPAPLLDTYRLGMSFSLQEYVTVGSATGMPVKPVGASFFPIEHFLASAYEPESKKPQTCSGGRSVEEYVLEFPETLKIVAIPKDFELSSALIEYRATYRRSQNTLTVRRELTDKTSTNVCSPQVVADYNKAVLNIARDLKAQVLVSD
jgi:transglutaminase-like putative cysteine protease